MAYIPPEGYAKTASSSAYPLFATDSGPFNRVEPLVTPETLTKQYLWGIPLTNPLTKQTLKPDDLKSFIDRAMNRAEMSLQLTILETQHTFKLAYDRPLANYYNYLECPVRPISRLDSLTIESADQVDLFTYPPQIIETRNMVLGQITLGLANTPASIPSNMIAPYGSGGAGMLFGNWMFRQNMPAYYLVKCAAGFHPGKIPIPINDYIATIATMDILSMLAPLLFRQTSSSLSMDGLSQSVSGPGPAIFQQRLAELQAKKDELESLIKGYYYSSIKLLNI